MESEAVRDASYVCDRWSCSPLPNAPAQVVAAWNVQRPLKDGRLGDLCGSAEVVILRNDFAPEACPAPVVLTGRDFERGGPTELYREGPGRWRIVWAQDLRGRRPWIWGVDAR